MNTQSKNELRIKYRALRDSFGEEFREKASRLACENLAKRKEFTDADTVLLYYPIKNEISPLPLIELCVKAGKTVAFPVCQRDDLTLIFKKITALDSLSPGSFGISEPNESCDEVKISEKAICVVPALAFSSDGYRLGYGKGYYDRFLSKFKGTSIGFSYSSLIYEKLPRDEHDVPLDIIISESEVQYIVK